MRTGNVNVAVLLQQAQAKLNESGTSKPSAQAAGGAQDVGSVSPILGQLQDRVAAQAQQTAATLSRLGQFKSSLDDAATAAGTLAGLGADSSAQDMRTALGQLVAAYNASLKNSVAADGSSDAGMARALGDLRSAVRGIGGASPDLAKLGLTENQDGSLQVDAQALDKAIAADAPGVAAALAKAGTRAGDAAHDALAQGSRFDGAIARAKKQADVLLQQDAAIEDAAKKLAAAPAPSFGSSSGGLLAAYLKQQ